MTTNVPLSGTIEVQSGDTVAFPNGVSGAAELLIDANGHAAIGGPSIVGDIDVAGGMSINDHTVHFNTASIAMGGFVNGSGGFLGTITSHGVIYAYGGLLTLGAVSGAGGTLAVDAGSTLELRCATTSPVDFMGNHDASLVLDKPSEFVGNLVNMNLGDSILFKNATVSSVALHGDTLTVLGAGGSLLKTFDLVAGPNAPNVTAFSVSPDAHTITVSAAA